MTFQIVGHAMQKTLRISAFTGLIAMVVALGATLNRVQADYVALRHARMIPSVGSYLPRISGTSLDGTPVAIGGSRLKRLQLLYFFDTTCPNCLESVPLIRQIHELTSSRGVEALGISFDSADVTREYVRNARFDFPVLSLTERRTLSLLQVQAVPALLFIRSDGQVVRTRLGSIKDPATVDSVANWGQEPPLISNQSRERGG